jgi:hypothetical protein
MTHVIRPLREGADVYKDEDNDDKFPDESPVEVCSASVTSSLMINAEKST